MKSIYLAVILSLFMFAGFGCSGSSSNAEDANANTAQESPFAHITEPAAALAEGDRLLDDNQTERAIQAYQQAIKLDPDFAEAHFKLGIAYALIEAELEKSGQLVETNAEGKRIKPASQKSFEKAVEAYKKLLATNLKDDVAQFNLGRAYNKLNKDEDAEDAFRQAVKLKADDTEYQTELGSILVKLAKYHEALAPLKKAIELDPENSRAIDLLEDAEAGARRIEFSQPANDSKSKANANANANINANTNSNTRPANANTKPPEKDPKDKKPTRSANKPN